MSVYKRVAKELEDLQSKLPGYLRDLDSEKANVLIWNVLLLPDKSPYNLKAFRVGITFPEEYPFKPPRVKFTTQIYHPSVDQEGQVCLPITSSQHWKPSNKAYQVLDDLNMLVNTPEESQPLRIELAELLAQNPKKFYEEAKAATLRFGVQRPT
ncbi:PREDICTED: ubiquitin/ISG15-conjugating enzyme E2 L6 [Elephantulus edwardii]|uniref:ubiquitin/ISG15-conjugating enzyme E2 L6 n=1 Tax=Elephantulus edwardii TaxID=28737 RepID=UPI0003F0E9CF|nr:PREDICTED: ubiquitin/ISG15-conjugating enzyme E2 L6 [Elephantulus edwardii]